MAPVVARGVIGAVRIDVEPHRGSNDRMSEENTTSNTDDAKKPTVPPSTIERDWFLQMLVRLANDSGLEMGLTLFVGGTAISGTLIGASTYFKELGSTLGTALGKTGSLDDVFEKMSSMADPKLPPSFVHLRGGRVFTGSAAPFPKEAVLWRGRLSEVGGFIVGTMSAT